MKEKGRKGTVEKVRGGKKGRKKGKKREEEKKVRRK